jgi:hypothetical protein
MAASFRCYTILHLMIFVLHVGTNLLGVAPQFFAMYWSENLQASSVLLENVWWENFTAGRFSSYRFENMQVSSPLPKHFIGDKLLGAALRSRQLQKLFLLFCATAREGASAQITVSKKRVKHISWKGTWHLKGTVLSQISHFPFVHFALETLAGRNNQLVVYPVYIFIH